MTDLAPLYEALAEFHASAPKVPMSGENPAFKRGGTPAKYSTIEDVVSVFPKLAACGLVLFWRLDINGEKARVIARLAHKSGAHVETDYPVTSGDSQAAQLNQKLGSALTYARRYTAYALLGIAGGEDDDANKADGVDRPEWRPERRVEGFPLDRDICGVSDANAWLKTYRAELGSVPTPDALNDLLQQTSENREAAMNCGAVGLDVLEKWHQEARKRVSK